MENFNCYQVPALKSYLSKKGITTTIYRKTHLIKLCELAREIDLEDVEMEDDYTEMDKRRRTVEGGRVLPSNQEVEFSDWSGDLKNIPEIDIADVFVHLIDIGWDQQRNQAYKSDKGFLLHQNNHVDNVRLFQIKDSSFTYVRCSTTPGTHQSEDPYITWLLLKSDGCITSGGCSCVADDRSCKHYTSLAFALAAFCDLHKNRHVEVGTDVRCVWDKPRKQSKPCRVEDIQTSHKGGPMQPNPSNYHPCPIHTLTAEKNRDIEKELFRICQGTGALLLQTLDPTSDESDDEPPENPPDMRTAAKYSNESGKSLIDYLQSVYNIHTIHEIENITCGQSENEL